MMHACRLFLQILRIYRSSEEKTPLVQGQAGNIWILRRVLVYLRRLRTGTI